MRQSPNFKTPQTKGKANSLLLLLAVALGLLALLLYPPAVIDQWLHPAPATATASAVVSPAAPAMPTPMPTGPALADFHKVIQPILQERCYDCHGDGESRAGVAFDKLTTDDQILKNPDLWLKVLKNTRAHIMPPSGHDGTSADQQLALENWIKYSAFSLDPNHLDPGRVTVHRLNRVEYKNTIRDLMGVNFETQAEFPGDDSGYGFDNIADVLNMSPLLMEKYLTAAQSIVDQVVPTVTSVPAVQVANVGDFKYSDGTPTVGTNIRASGIGASGIPAIALSYLEDASISHVFEVKQAGDYRVMVEQNLRGDFVFTTQHCLITVNADGKQLSQKNYGWAGNDDMDDSYTVHWEPGSHTIAIALAPVLPLQDKGRAGNDNVYNLKKVRLEGPLDPAKWVHPPNYTRFFSRDEIPATPGRRRAYAKEILSAFATKAFRRPVPSDSLDQLAEMAAKVYSVPGNTFETGIAHAMVAVLASPRFLFRVEQPSPTTPLAPYADVDEHSLASRLSYFLWSSMPDDELLKLAATGKLRANLIPQVKRMLADPRSTAFTENFTGEWLQSRLVSSVPLNPHEILLRQGIDASPPFTDAMRADLKQEPEKYFDYVFREDRSVDEFLSSDYIFINNSLANIYNISGVTGPEFRKVTLPPGDSRGGLLTTGSVLMVTSNPTRTSPVKRGKWMLDNILGAPTPPPPPNIPALEDSTSKISSHVPTLRETLAVHRKDAVCASCHDRMDPLGLAMESFSALGQLRTQDLGQPIDPSGQLPTGESFADIRSLKQILITKHRLEFYRCLTEKLMTYAIGRGMEYYDVPSIDKIVENLDNNHGKFSALLIGVIESVPFQQQRTFPNPLPDTAKPAPRLTQTNPTHEDDTLR